MYETFDHTADLGLRIQAQSLNELFAEAGKALFSVLVENSETIEPRERFSLSVFGTDREYLLFDWLKELLYRFEVEHRLYCRFDVAVSNAGLEATIWGETLDRARHELGHEVKAITYHGLKVEQGQDGWLAEVIVDI
jgi:SHS2 domain-containing protein